MVLSSLFTSAYTVVIGIIIEVRCSFNALNSPSLLPDSIFPQVWSLLFFKKSFGKIIFTNVYLVNDFDNNPTNYFCLISTKKSLLFPPRAEVFYTYHFSGQCRNLLFCAFHSTSFFLNNIS